MEMGFPVKKQLKAVAMLLETLAFLACIAVLDSGIIDKWLTEVPFLAYALTAAAAIMLAIIILTSISSAPLFKRRRILLALSFATVGAVHLTTQDFPAYTAAFTYPHSSFYFLYYACILIYAACGSGPPWRGRWRSIRRSCSSTNRRPGSIRLPPSVSTI